MSQKQHHQHKKRLLLPPSPPPRNPFANLAKMQRGVEIHESGRGALRREQHMKLERLLKGKLSAFEE